MRGLGLPAGRLAVTDLQPAPRVGDEIVNRLWLSRLPKILIWSRSDALEYDVSRAANLRLRSDVCRSTSGLRWPYRPLLPFHPDVRLPDLSGLSIRLAVGSAYLPLAPFGTA